MRYVGPIVIAEHKRRALDFEHAAFDSAVVAVDQPDLHQRMRISNRHFRLRQPQGVRPEHHGARFCRAVGVGHPGSWQSAPQVLQQGRAHRRRTHPDELDAGQIGPGEERLLAQHHRDHRRHRGQPGATVASDRVDIGLGCVLRQQDDGGVGCAGELAERQRIHMIEGRRNQVAVTRKILPVEPGFDDPDVALVREHDALRLVG